MIPIGLSVPMTVFIIRFGNEPPRIWFKLSVARRVTFLQLGAIYISGVVERAGILVAQAELSVTAARLIRVFHAIVKTLI